LDVMRESLDLPREGGREQPTATWRQDMVAAAFAAWLVLGMLLDGRAHKTLGLPANGESFVSPWHGVLYSGFLALAAWVLHLAESPRTLQDRQRIPTGYGLALLGIPLFLLSGLADMVWHLLFGFEDALEAGMSPPHLGLFVSGILLCTGPLRSAWAAAPRAPSLRRFLPAALASVVNWSNTLLTPLPWGRLATPPTEELLTALDLMLFGKVLVGNFLIVGATMLVLRRWRPPFGALTLVWSLVGLLAALEDNFQVPALIPALAVAGLGLDLLVRWLAPAPERPGRFLAAGAGAGIILWSAYFAFVALSEGMRWTHQMWSGMILLTGLCGWGLAYLALPAPSAGDPVAARLD
jgi:hypothetical protein